MFAPLLAISIDSIYKDKNGGNALPARMAKCTPDMHAAALALKADVKTMSADLVLSDMFRSFKMQFDANQDFVTKKKTAFSPPPGGSMHEAGRAFDMDLDQIRKLTLAKFWPVAAKHGIVPIIDKPVAGVSESWHFDRRGSHGIVYDYYTAKKGTNFKPYTAMAASGIVSIGQKVTALGDDPRPGYIQSGLIRLGKEIGNLDGSIGNGSRKALDELGIDSSGSIDAIADAIDKKLQQTFPEEYAVPAGVKPVPPT